jgi:peptidoglycan/LPS O-acetylase OafA/YrhL
MPSRLVSAKPDARHGTISSVNLNAIRGAAALVVLLGHTRSLFFSSLSGTGDLSTAAQNFGQSAAPRPGLITMGNEAVIVFFVLSGYLVGGSAIRDLKNGAWSWRRYLIQRLTRLWVVLLPALLFGIAVDHSGLRMFAGAHSIYTGPPELCVVPCNVADRITPTVVAGNAIFLQNILVDTAGSNNALWSLANEFWYYLAFPLGLLALRSGETMLRRTFYVALLVAIAALVGKAIILLFFVWLLGAFISIVPLKVRGNPLKLCTGLLAILFPAVFVLVRRAYLPIYLAEWIIAICFSVLLYLLLHGTERARAGLYKSTADFFSRISYTLYLVHLPLAVFLCACINTPWHHWDKSPWHLAMFFLLNLVLVAFSYAFYLVFEANTDQIRRALFYRRTPELNLSRAVLVQANKRTPPVVSETDVSVGWR